MISNIKRTKKRIRIVFIVLASVFAGYVLRGYFPATLKVLEESAMLSAAMMMPEGGAGLAKELYFSPKEQISKDLPSVSGHDEENEPFADDTSKSESPSSVPSVSSTAEAYAVNILEKNRMPIKEETFGHAGSSYDSVWVQNRTKNHSVDIKAELSKKVDFKIEKNDKPQVLIVHTHTTEAFEASPLPYYDKTKNSRTRDYSKNIAAVGEAITSALNAKGIKTVQDKTIHDDPSYTGAYDRSKVTIQNMIKKYPSIKVVIDVHRDAITRDNGTKIKPVVTINGKKAAQIMIVTGCDDDGTLGFPDWEMNLRFAVRLQQTTEKMYPMFARPVSFAVKKYNMNINHGSLLVEFGSEANTLDEAIYSGQLFANSLAETLNKINNEK